MRGETHTNDDADEDEAMRMEIPGSRGHWRWSRSWELCPASCIVHGVISQDRGHGRNDDVVALGNT